MPTPNRHQLRPALVALATLAGLLMATAGASACESMKSAGGGSCSPSGSSCGCCEADTTGRPEVDGATIVPRPEACVAAGPCCRERTPEIPAEPSPKSARVADDVRADRGNPLSFGLPDLLPPSLQPGPAPSPIGSPPHVPIYLRNARLLT